MGKTVSIKSLEEMCNLMCDNKLPIRNRDDDFEFCYQTGLYEDYICELCPHNFECSGYEERD